MEGGIQEGREAKRIEGGREGEEGRRGGREGGGERRGREKWEIGKKREKKG